ncbi:hypothetical protein LUZ60_002210 [Juncus effusus]|nr:hypothetical protein LUZ60_002210 [Juncus effusus]
MEYTYRPTYYSSIQHSLTSLYKSVFKSSKRRLLTEEKAHAETLKRQQEQFHKILHLTALCKEGIVSETEVSDFRVKLLESVSASPANQEAPCVIRDKLLFLQELLHSKCISEEEYHSFKRPLLQRLAIQGEKINSKDIIFGSQEISEATQKATQKTTQVDEEEWSVIDLQDPIKENNSVEKPKHKNPLKQLIKPYHKSSKNKEKSENISSNSKNETAAQSEKGKRRDREGSERKGWGLEGFKKWKKGGGFEEDSEKPCLDRLDRSDLETDPVTDKVLGDSIKEELSRIKTELSAMNPKLNFSDEQVEAISTKLPTDKSDLKNYFPKKWCEMHGDNVLQVVKKEFKEHVSEIENARNNPDINIGNSHDYDYNGSNKDWVNFDDDSENFHPNIFSMGQQSKGNNQMNERDCFVNPFSNH